jgi:hypothetical protein
MEQRDHGRDSGIEEIVDEFLVEGNASRVDGVIAPADRNDARPGDREAVAF